MIESKEFQHTISILTKEISKYDNPDFFLGAGVLANSLFYYNLSKYTEKDFYIEQALNEFEKIYENIENVDIGFNMDLVSGYSGVAWLFQ